MDSSFPGASEAHVLSVPANDVESPSVTVLVPAMNEEITIAKFCQWCHEGFLRAGVVGEILIIDSSTDRTPEIAISNGARVLAVPRRGIGKAYRDALRHIRGEFVVIGDADCTYDFRDLGIFVTKLREGFDLVVGSRFKGKMERGSMPVHHKYFGSPLTTALADVLLGLRLTDIHCGMRGIRKKSFIELKLKSDGWEYASEMIVNSVRQGYRITEIPIPFSRDVEGRISHVKRQGWLTPFRAGWGTIAVLLTNSADFLLVKPGVLFSVIGSTLLATLSLGPVTVFETTFTLNTMLFGLGLAGLGYYMTGFGIVTRCIYDRTLNTVSKWNRILSFNRVAPASFFVMAGGLLSNYRFVRHWFENNRQLGPSSQRIQHLAFAGVGVSLLASSVFVTMLTVRVLAVDGRKID